MNENTFTPEMEDQTFSQPDPKPDISEASNDEETERTVMVVVGCSRLNIRQEPSKNAEVLEVLAVGDHVYASEYNKTWMEVETDNEVVGYAMKEFLEEE